jgi:hypothetical protein
MTEKEIDDFMYAVSRGFHRKVSAFVENGVDVNMQHKHYGPALGMAVRHRQVKTALVLIELGADPTLRSEPGDWSAFDDVHFNMTYRYAHKRLSTQRAWKEVMEVLRDKWPDAYLEWWIGQAQEER